MRRAQLIFLAILIVLPSILIYAFLSREIQHNRRNGLDNRTITCAIARKVGVRPLDACAGAKLP